MVGHKGKHHQGHNVYHCFYDSKEIAEQYLNLGYHIGIGGSVIQLEERATTDHVIRLFSLPITTNTQKKRDS